MPNKFASGKFAIAQCDRCNFRYKLTKLKKITIKRTQTNLLVCPNCWEAPHPQSFQGERPVNDPQALRNPRPDSGFIVGGVGSDGDPSGGSRIFQWGYAPVGGSRDGGLTPNDLIVQVQLGTVAVVTETGTSVNWQNINGSNINWVNDNGDVVIWSS